MRRVPLPDFGNGNRRRRRRLRTSLLDEVSASEDLILRGENLLEFQVVLQCGEFGFGLELIPVLEAVFKRLANILQGPVRQTGLGTALRQDVEIPGALLDR